jgi:hypothetical protein
VFCVLRSFARLIFKQVEMRFINCLPGCCAVHSWWVSMRESSALTFLRLNLCGIPPDATTSAYKLTTTRPTTGNDCFEYISCTSWARVFYFIR